MGKNKGIKACLFNIALAAAASAASFQASAGTKNGDDGAYLDPPYDGLIHPVRLEDEGFLSVRRSGRAGGLPKSDTAALIAKQSPVKSQGSRGACSIFSATALLESLLISHHDLPTTTDLSEEWLEYLAVRNSQTDGSHSYRNFTLIETMGAVEEELMPYVGELWESASFGPAKDRCGQFSSSVQKSCLLAHRNPDLLNATEEELGTEGNALYDLEFQKARKRSSEFKTQYFAKPSAKDYSVYVVEDVKRYLAKGVPLTLDVDFFYGAWNHRKSESLGIDRNLDHWAKGIVFYPVEGSVDRINSRKEPAGHSILIVGYDDEREVTKTVKMKDGTTKDVTYKGVYYFKNSWGTGSFGTQTEIDGKTYPGYGMIVQKYAEEYGEFYRLPYGQEEDIRPIR